MEHLRCLGQFKFGNIEVPEATQLNGGIKLTNVKPDGFLFNTRLQEAHYSAVEELYEKTTQVRTLSTISSWNQSQMIFFLCLSMLKI